MLRNLSQLEGFVISARDGQIGKVQDLYFDDEKWVVRDLVVRTGGWLFGKEVLISPIAVQRVNWDDREVQTRLSREQVRGSPDVNTKPPVSRQEERKLHLYYGMPVYWGGSALWGDHSVPAALALRAQLDEQERESIEADVDGDAHLRSARELDGYFVGARDGEVGHARGFLFEESSWALRYLVVDTRNWLPGRKVLVFPQWITRVNWYEQKIEVDLERKTIRSAPEFRGPESVSREYEESLFDHYGLPKYWQG